MKTKELRSARESFTQRGRAPTPEQVSEEIRIEREIRRDNFARLEGTEEFPLLKDIARAAGFNDTRASHLKSGYRHISADYARKLEASLGLKRGYFDVDRRHLGVRHTDAKVDKDEAVKLFLTKAAGAKEIAKTYGVSEVTLYQWVAEAKRDENDTARVRRLPIERASASASDDRLAKLERANAKLTKVVASLLAGDTDAD